MRTLPIAIVLLLLTLALGCRGNNAQVMVEQEARMLEDEVYSLEAQLDACCQAREALARENEELRRQIGGGGSSRDYRSPASSAPSSPSSRGPLTEAPRLEAPSIELPEATTTPPDTLIPGDEEPIMPGPGDGSSTSRQPVEMVINRRMTGGIDRDRAGGDEGLMVFVEPRDDQGNLVHSPGAVSIVLMDPSKTGDESRIARWDFQAHEFDDHFKKSIFGNGLQYELKWPGEAPASRDLMLFVRYISPEGTKLTSDAPLAIRLAGDYPRESRETLVTAEEPSRGSQGGQPRAEVRVPSSDEQPREIETANQPLIGPRQAKRELPEWKPYR